MNSRELRKNPFARALLEYIRWGNEDSNHPEGRDIGTPNGVEIRASNATDMNIGTPADGGYLDGTLLGDEIIARRSELSLADKLGCTLIPGKGSNLQVAVDNEADGEFIITTEGAPFDLDAPAVDQVVMTLANYSKTILLSLELQEDAGPRLLNFLLNWIARCQAKTYNQLLLAAVAATGTSYKTAASATAIVAGELETVCDNDSVGFYEEEDAPSIAWVMKPSTFRAIKAITGNPRLYGDYADGKRQLLEYPVCLSSKAGAMTAGLKPVYFGNWRFVAYRETGLSILRDPFSAASTGQIRIWLNFQTVFKVLQPAAVGYLIMHT